MFRFFLICVVIAGALVALKNNHVLQRAGLSGSCSAIMTPRGQTGYWQACRPGRLEGQPDLSRRSCTPAGTRGELAFWRCPTRIETSPVRP